MMNLEFLTVSLVSKLSNLKRFQYYSIAEILDYLPSIYPELEESTNSIITSLCEHVSDEKNKSSKQSPSCDFEIEDITRDQLCKLVKEFGPYQLVHKS
jgi:hypothetical protein